MKKWVWIGIGCAVLVGIVFLPQILSTTVGKRFFIHTLNEKTGGKSSVDHLSLTWFGPQEASDVQVEGKDFSASAKSVQADVPLWRFNDLLRIENLPNMKGSYHVHGGEVRVASQGALERIDISLRAHGGVADFKASGQTIAGESAGSFLIQGQMKSKTSYSFRADLSSFPTVLVDRYWNLDLSELIGEKFSLDGFVTLEDGKGPCSVSVYADHGDASVRGTIDKKLFLLSEPIQGTIQLTPALAKKILSGINPLFITGISSESPIQFRIETKDFSLALDPPFRWTSLKIGGAMLDMGKVRCTNGDILNAMISMLKNGALMSAPEMVVWFTPVHFKLEGGVLESGRMDALAAESIRLCTWGNVNLIKDRLDMTLGIPAETLRKLLGVKRVPDEYVLRVPIRGTTQKPKLSVGDGAARIAALMAAEHAPKGAGGVLNLFLQPNNEVPKANRPFPWE